MTVALSEGKKKILDARKTLEKRYADLGDGLFPPLDGKTQIETIPTPSAIINAVVGVGGLPRGRITEIFGPESTGKTTIAIETARSAQEADPATVVLFLDYEHAFDHTYAARLGLDVTDPTRFIFAQPNYFEQGAEILETFIQQGLIDLAIIDSVAAMLPLATFEGDRDAGQTQGKSTVGRIGLHAQLLSQNLNWLTKRITHGRKPAILAINQTRTKLNTQSGFSYQDSTGGQALKFYSTIRLELGRAKGEGKEGRRSSDPIDELHQQARVEVTCVKNKIAPPWRRGAIVIRPNVGICNVDSTADLAAMYMGIRSGAWYKYEGPSPELSFSVQGREALLAKLEASPELLRHLEKEALEKLKASHEIALKPRAQAEVKILKIKSNQKKPKEEGSNGAEPGSSNGDTEVVVS